MYKDLSEKPAKSYNDDFNKQIIQEFYLLIIGATSVTVFC